MGADGRGDTAAVTAGFATRLRFFGIMEVDIQRAQADTWDGNRLAVEFERSGDSILRQACAARAAGAKNLATDLSLRAIGYLHFACSRLPVGDAEEIRLSTRVETCYASLAAALHPSPRPIRLRTDGGWLEGWERLPTDPTGVVLLLNGLDSCKEVESHVFGDALLAYGLAVIAVDLPGFGGSRACQPGVGAIDGAIDDFIRQRAAGEPVGVFGPSFGGTLAIRAAQRHPVIRAAVSMGGIVGRRVTPKLPRHALQRACHLLNVRPGDDPSSALDGVLREHATSPPRCPVLLVHGDRDHLVDDSDLEELAHLAGQRCEVARWQGGEHVCTNHFPSSLYAAAQWIAAHLQRPSAANGDVRSASARRAGGAQRPVVVDLTRPLSDSPDGPVPFEIRRLSHRDGAQEMARIFGVSPDALPDGLGWASEFVKGCTHTGTHVDAPWHYAPTSDGARAKTIDEVPLEWFIGPGVVLDLRPFGNDHAVSWKEIMEAFERVHAAPEPGMIVLARTFGTIADASTSYADRGPGFSAEAIIGLVESGVRLIGTDAWGIDRPFRSISERFRQSGRIGEIWPAHYAGRTVEYCQLEQLCQLEVLPTRGFTVMALPVPIVGASAAWVRAVALLDSERPQSASQPQSTGA